MVIAGLGLTPAVHAGPVTNNYPIGQAPFTKLGVYNTVLRIVAASGTSLDFGHAGRDIIGSSNLIFRPGRGSLPIATQAQGVKVTANAANSADLYITSDLCLGTPSPGVCGHQLGDGSINGLWSAGVDQAGLRYIQPTPLQNQTPALHIASDTNPTVTLTGTGSGVSVQNRGTGIAADFGGDVVANNLVTVYGRLTVVGQEVWHPALPGVPANDYIPGGVIDLDADLANGNQVTIESAASCADTADAFTQPHVACVCFSEKYANQANISGQYAPVTLSPSPQKHCIDLANRF